MFNKIKIFTEKPFSKNAISLCAEDLANDKVCRNFVIKSLPWLVSKVESDAKYIKRLEEMNDTLQLLLKDNKGITIDEVE